MVHCHNLYITCTLNVSCNIRRLNKNDSIDDLIVFNNKKFWEYVENTNQSDNLASYLDLTFTTEKDGKLSTKLYDKHDDFDFHIVNFPFLSYHLALLMVFTSRSSLEIQDAAHSNISLKRRTNSTLQNSLSVNTKENKC